MIPETVTKEQKSHTYANEADVLNVALFGKTAKIWREENPDKDGSIDGQYPKFIYLIIIVKCNKSCLAF